MNLFRQVRARNWPKESAEVLIVVVRLQQPREADLLCKAINHRQRAREVPLNSSEEEFYRY